MNRILIVSNRPPVTVRIEGADIQIQTSAGGLATALKGPHERSDSLWIGWPGDLTRLPPERHRAVDQALLQSRCIPVHLTPGELNRFYEGFSNGVLWPLYHYLTDKVDRFPGATEGIPLLVAIGHDRTDEDLFARLPTDGIAIHVGLTPTRAPYRLPDVRAVRDFLWQLAATGHESSPDKTHARSQP